jgi:hypothetical protein
MAALCLDPLLYRKPESRNPDTALLGGGGRGLSPSAYQYIYKPKAEIFLSKGAFPFASRAGKGEPGAGE